MIADEIAHWRTDLAGDSPDGEIVNALRPGLATIPSSMIIGISSPYSKAGLLYRMFKDNYGLESDRCLVWRAASTEMNPTLDPAIVEQALAEDPESAKAEFLAQFRSDISGFITKEALELVVIPNRRSLPNDPKMQYVGFIDTSGGQSDSYCLAIAHQENETAILDLLVETKAPFNPDSVTETYAKILKSYGITSIQSDRYASDWVVSRWATHGIRCEQTAKPMSEIYRSLLPLIHAGRVELLDLPVLTNQLSSLERRATRGGEREVIDHPPHTGKDDVANACAGALLLASSGTGQAMTVAAGWAAYDDSVLLKPDALPPERRAVDGLNDQWFDLSGKNWSGRH